MARAAAASTCVSPELVLTGLGIAALRFHILAVDVQSTGDTSSESEQEAPQLPPSLQPVANPTSKKAKAKRRAQERARKLEAAAADGDVNQDSEAAEEPPAKPVTRVPLPPAVQELAPAEIGTEQNGVGKSPVPIIDGISTATPDAPLSAISNVQIDVAELAPSTSASVTSSDDDEEVETETGAEESAAESAAPTVKAPSTPRQSFSHTMSPVTPSRIRSEEKKQVDHGKDHAPATRWKNVMVRTTWSLVMIGGFIGALTYGPALWLMCTVLNKIFQGSFSLVTCTWSYWSLSVKPSFSESSRRSSPPLISHPLPRFVSSAPRMKWCDPH
jgi:hypothetical protein